MRGEKQRRLARCVKFDFGTEDHGMPFLFGHFEGEGWVQGFGYMVDTDFMQRFLRVFEVERMQQVNGRACWVTYSYDRIHKVEPLLSGEGTTFDIDEWRAEKEREAATREQK